MSDDTTETKTAFARRLGCSRTYVGKLASRGMPLADDGRVPVDHALRWLEDHDKMPAGATNAAPDVEATARQVADGDFAAGEVVATVELQSRWPALATVAAVESGLPAEQARALFDRIAAAFSEDGRNWLAERGVDAFTGNGDPKVWRSATVEPAWDRLGEE